jgi:hypothetical protein
MHFNTHFRIAQNGSHAFLSASKYAWLNYDEDKLDRVFAASEAAERGTRLHKLAADCIREGIKLQSNGTTLSQYVNDAIGFRMSPEQVLYYSDNAYGTPDAIAFRKERSKHKLRIHDLKTGITPASFSQLDIYAAFFFLEYGRTINMTPFDVSMEFRIYQNDEVTLANGDPDVIVHIMEKIKIFDKRITAMRLEDAGL